MMMTEAEFTLPKGYLDTEGTLHRQGTMRLATAADEILPLKDPRVTSNPAYLVIILLSRVITQLGSLSTVTPKIIEGLFVSDLTFLQDFYNRLNGIGEPLRKEISCPDCGEQFSVELETARPSGE